MPLRVWYCLKCRLPVRGDIPRGCRCEHPVISLHPTLIWQ